MRRELVFLRAFVRDVKAQCEQGKRAYLRKKGREDAIGNAREGREKAERNAREAKDRAECGKKEIKAISNLLKALGAGPAYEPLRADESFRKEAASVLKRRELKGLVGKAQERYLSEVEVDRDIGGYFEDAFAFYGLYSGGKALGEAEEVADDMTSERGRRCASV